MNASRQHRLRAVERTQEYEVAVTLLLEACNKLARLEFERVGALRDMKRNMAMRRNVLHKMIVQVRHHHTCHAACLRAIGVTAKTKGSRNGITSTRAEAAELKCARDQRSFFLGKRGGGLSFCPSYY